ncbi:hypothetical protein [Candidatus Mycoplasma haematominutum]|uniref:Uncharacterized protein n=1 Tax=Candidatus Mycoplasma haematominutum 'Birmingham 1' TaxID=1116213 RepID=G8C3Z5_9MOLU|nr:hypothetical protein [Candidatus Mycoplasma haematominutum]CCE67043.1 hypothetical protein (homolog to MSU_0859) [Candidatus Mycoplasma haematominutum 'Birmingham 1']
MRRNLCPKKENEKDATKLSRKEQQRRNKAIIEMAERAIYKLCVLNMRNNYTELFVDQLLQYWDVYAKEVRFALNSLLEHEKKFLEDCFMRKLTYDKMFISRSTYYRSLVKYSKKFLSLFDYELYHKYLSTIYNSIFDSDEMPPTSST